jgi:hypothetical protein
MIRGSTRGAGRDRQTRIAAEGVDAFQFHDEVEAFVDQQRERVRRIQADRRHHRRHFLPEVALHPALLCRGPAFAAHDADAVPIQFRQQALVEDGVLRVIWRCAISLISASACLG